MTSRFSTSARVSTSALVLGLSLPASSAFADVTVQDVWGDWRDNLRSSGYELTADETTSGDTLFISNMQLAGVLDDNGATFSLRLGDLAFTDNGDGMVSVKFPTSTPIVLNMKAPETEELTVALELLATEMDMVVSGDPNDIAYTYTADNLTLKTSEFLVDAEPVDLGTAAFSFSDLNGVTTSAVDALRTREQTMSTGLVAYDIDMVDPEDPTGRIVVNGTMAGTELSATGLLPLDMDPNAIDVALTNGFSLSADFSLDDNAADFQFSSDGDTVEGTTTTDLTAVVVKMNDEGVVYETSTEDIKVSFAGSDIPLPVEFAIQSSGFNLAMPLVESEDEQAFALGFKMADFTVSDFIWGLFDPSGQLPRDPATIAIDMTGKAKLFFDLLNVEALEQAESGDDLPAELNALDINSLILRIAGAELNGSGSFGFDNTDLETFDGFPAPDGAIDLTLTGANALLDSLVALGFVPQEQATGARLMMGLFAVPGDEEDTLNSRIEVKSNGQVLANGQRLR